MKIIVLTQFPELFQGVLSAGILARAAEKGLVETEIINIRDYSTDRHRKTDDTPFGGGAGMVMTPQPAFDALRAVDASKKRRIYMSPRGRLLDRTLALSLASEDEVVILCGHYEGVDQRIIDSWNMEEVSIGDYIVSGGELPAMVLIDVVTRFIPGVLGNEESNEEESIYSGLLEYDQYTKPRDFEGLEVPEVLCGGNHELIRLWQLENALRKTGRARPDLFASWLENHKTLTKKEKALLDTVLSETADIEDEI